jgi:alpha-1,3-rhamnosyl/mannosyltransferase
VIAGSAGWGNVGLPNQATELAGEGSLRFIGEVSDARLRDLYEGAIALCFPSLYEGFGMPVVEAMSCGTHVIHTAKTSIDEITAHLGLPLPATDVAAWTDAIQEAIASTPQSTKGDREHRIRRARMFDWTTSAARVKNAYSSLVT